MGTSQQANVFNIEHQRLCASFWEDNFVRWRLSGILQNPYQKMELQKS